MKKIVISITYEYDDKDVEDMNDLLELGTLLKHEWTSVGADNDLSAPDDITVKAIDMNTSQVFE